MSIFDKIRDAILPRKKQDTPRPTGNPGLNNTTIGGASQRPAGQASNPAASTLPSANAQPRQISEDDVEQRLDSMSGADNLNWRTSIVDLMKLVGLDASYQERKELAHELGDADYSGKAEENAWLHRQVMNKLAANGGRVPADLRD